MTSVKVQVDGTNHYVSKCYLPAESSVFLIYAIFPLSLLVYLSVYIYLKYFNRFMLLTFTNRIKAH